MAKLETKYNMKKREETLNELIKMLSEYSDEFLEEMKINLPEKKTNPFNTMGNWYSFLWWEEKYGRHLKRNPYQSIVDPKLYYQWEVKYKDFPEDLIPKEYQ